MAPKTGFFRFKKLDKKDYLLTNEVGLFAFLDATQFKNFLDGKLEKTNIIYEKFEVGDASRLVDLYQERNRSLFRSGPSLHIIVVTLSCNLNCVYCQAASKPLHKKGYNMTLNTAKETVDFILSTYNLSATIEFQGGEPLVNWPIVKFIVEYAKRRNQIQKKDLRFSLVSNLTMMTDDKLDFLMKNNVSICTSLDGPEKVHNKNRLWTKGNSYQKTAYWLKKISKHSLRGALVTISRNSLKYPKEIVNEYLKWGFPSVHLRPITYLGSAKNAGNRIGYSAEEFINFWKKAMDYIILLNKKGTMLYEREAQIMLQKILTNQDPGYTDLRSPCGAAVGQLLYDYDGTIYTCDEGRMVGDDTFAIGNVDKNNYKGVISHNKVKTMLTASCLDNLSCDNCVYKPYCGVCPVRNYVYYGNLFPQIQNTDWCKIKMAQFNYLFEKMCDDKETKAIFEKWASKN